MINKIQSIFLDYNIFITEHQSESFMVFYKELVEYNSKVNLTAITDFEGVVYKHFLDSASVIKYISFDNCTSVIDIGSGAGFPGIVLAILLPDINFVSVESLNKKAAFQNTLKDILKLENLDVISNRAEDLGTNPAYREQFDIAVSRAVAPMNVLMEYCLPFVKLNGKSICYKSQDVTEELIIADNAIKSIGGKIDQTYKFKLPYNNSNRSIITIKKILKTPSKFPRRAGIPTKRPIE